MLQSNQLGRLRSLRTFTFVNPLGNSNYYRIIDATGEGGPPTSGYRLHIYHDAAIDKVRAMVIVMKEGVRFDAMIDLDDPVGWHFVAFAFDPGKDELRLNIDGRESIRDLPADFDEVTFTDTDVILGGTGSSHFFQEFLMTLDFIPRH